MATIRIPFADTQIATPQPGAGQVRTQLQPSMRDSRAGQLPGDLGQRSAQAAMLDPQAAAAPGRAAFVSAREAGQAALNAGSRLDQMAKAEQDLQDQTQLTRLGVDLQRATLARQSEFETREFPNSADAQRQFREASLADAARLGESLSGRARALWDARSEEIVASREFNVARDVQTRIHQGAIATTEDSVRALANQAAAARNPVERATIMEQAEGAIRTLQTAGAVNPQAAGRMLRGFRQDVQQADVTRLMGENPTAAIALLQDIRQTPDLDADRRAALVNQALTRRDAMAARAEAQTARREQQVSSAVQEVNGLLAQGLQPTQRIEALQALARGTRQEGAVRQLIEDSRSIGNFGLASLADQQRMIQEADTRRRGANATDADQAQYARLVTIQQQQIQGFAQDGLGFAVRLGTVDPQPPINWTDPTTLQSRVDAASGESARRGYAISPFNREDLSAGVQQFERANPDQRLAMVQAMGGIQDPQVRAAAFLHFERARGTNANMPAGTLVRVYDMIRSGTIESQQSARRILGDLSVRVEGRTRAAGESAEMNAALISAQSSGVLAARIAAANIAGGGPFAELVRRDQEAIQQAAAARLTSGATSATTAVREAQADWERGLLAVNDRNLAHVYFPADRANVAQVTAGLRLLREEAGRVTLDPAAGADANMAARARRDAAAVAVWVNEGDRFALVSRGAGGAQVVLRTATLDEVTGAHRARVERDAAAPPVMQREQALENMRRDQRRQPAPPPVVVQ